MTYRVVLIAIGRRLRVSCPGLAGCWSQGATEQEALENIRDAIREYLEAVAELTRGQDVREVEVAFSDGQASGNSTSAGSAELWKKLDSAFCARASTS